MPIEMNIDSVRAQLEALRAKHGEAVYQQARRDLALALIGKPNGEAHIRLAFPDMDIEELKAAAAPTPAPSDESGGSFYQGGQAPSVPDEQLMMRLLQQQMPSIKTQGHLNLFQAAFDALRTTLDGAFSGDADRARRGREALLKVLDTAGNVHEVMAKLDEMPPEARSDAANEFLQPPKQFHEYDIQRRLLVELEGLLTMAALTDWYTATKDDRDRVVSQKLRNELLDAIRAKKNILGKEAN